MKIRDVRALISAAFIVLFTLLLKGQLEVIKYRPELKLFYIIIDIMLLAGFLLSLIAHRR